MTLSARSRFPKRSPLQKPASYRPRQAKPWLEALEDRSVPASLVLLNELNVNAPGNDGPQEYIELRGVPGATLSNIFFTSIEGDSGASVGKITYLFNLDGKSLGSNGLLIIHSANATNHNIPPETTVINDPALDGSTGVLQNGTNSFALVQSGSALSVGQDLDTNDDGVLDLPGGAVVIDIVGWSDGGGSDKVYGANLTTTGFTNGAATRFLHDNRPTEAAAWYSGALAGASNTTTYSETLRSANFPTGGALTPGDVNVPDGPNDAPNGAPDSYSVATGGTVTGNVLDNDSDPNDGQAPNGEVILSARLVSGPAHASSFVFNTAGVLNPNGAFTYTHNGNSATADSFTYIVTDLNLESSVVTVEITIGGGGGNNPPELDPIGNQSVDEQSLLTFTATADDPDAGQTLTFSLIGAPAGASINATTGVFTWTPTEAQGPNSFTFTVRVTDDGAGNLFDEEEITVTVNEVNQAPVLDPIGNQTVDEGSLLTFTATASDADLPANGLSFSLIGAPAGASINATTGVFTWTPTEAQGPNTFTFTVRVTDNGTGSLFDEEEITVTVNEVNQVPVLDPIGDQTVDEGSLLTFTASATDADLPANTLTYSLIGAPAGASINSSTGVFTWTPTEAQGPNSFTFTVRVTDTGPGNLFDEETIQVTVNEVNQAPVLDPIGDQSVNEGDTLTFTATATDADLPANSLTYSLIGAPDGASINPTTGVFTWTPTPDQGPNTYTVTIRVTDDGTGNLFDEETIDIIVNDENTPPVLDPIGNQSVDEGSLLTFTATASDPDLPAQGLTFSLISAPAGALINATTGVFTWTPTEAQGPNTFTFTVRVTDDGPGSLFDEETIEVTVNEVNQAPVLDPIGNQAVDEGSLLTFTATASDADLPANSLTYSLIGAPAGASINATTGVFTWTPTEAQGPNTFTFTVRVTDNGTGSLFDEEEITVTVNEVNQVPVLDPIGDQTVDEGSLLTFTASATDADLPANTLTYSLIGAPAGASINSSTGVFTWTPTEAQGPNTFTFTVRVTDNGTGSLFDEETIEVTVNEVNQAPVLDPIGNQSVDEGDLLTFTATASDADLPANGLTYSLIGAPAGASINSSTGVFTWTPTETQGPNTFTFTVRVTDDGTGSLFDEEEITVTVNEVNQAPVLDPIGDQSVNEGALLTFTASATDADLPANTLTYSLIGAPAGASINSSTGVFTWTPTEAQGSNTFTFTVRVTDDGTGSLFDEEEITVTVNEVNQAPVLDPIGDQTVNEGDLLTFTATATDADLPANSLTYSLVGAPDGASINATTGVFTWTPTADQGPNTYTVTIRVTDDGTGSLFDEEAIQITVTEGNQAPIASAGGPYTVAEGNSFTLDASGSSDPDAGDSIVTYAWDLDNDGFFDDAFSASPTFVVTWTDLVNLGINDGLNPGVPLTVGLRVTDSFGLTDTASTTLTVTNAAPTATGLGNNGPISEGGSATVSLTGVSDPSPVDSGSLRFSFALSEAGLAADYATASGTNAANFAFPDNGSFQVFGRVYDKDGGISATFATTVVVNNAAPVLTGPSNQNANEGGTFSFNLGSFTDAGVNDNPWTVAVTWGDTGSDSFTVAAQGGISLSHTYLDNGTYTVNVTVTDKDGGASNTVSFQVTVANLAPAATGLGNNGPISEGGSATVSLTGVSDPSPVDSGSLRFSFALSEAGLAANYATASGTNSGSFAFPDNGSFQVFGRVYDKDGGISATFATTVVVNNVAPTVTSFTITGGLDGNGFGTAGSPISFQAAASDPGTLDSFTYQFDWNYNGVTFDVEDTVGPVGPAGRSPVSISHAYAADGTYQPAVRVIDKDGGTSAIFLGPQVVVGNAVVYMQDGNLIVMGSAGNDNITVDGTNRAAVRVNRNAKTYNHGPFDLSGGGRIIVHGLAGADVITVNGPVSAEIHGGDGNDYIYGGSGNDVVFGGDGNDYFSLGGGDDLAIGGFGRDNLTGGNGNDVLVGGHVDPALWSWAQLQQVVSDWNAWNGMGTPPALLTALRDATTDPADTANYDRFWGNTGKDLFIYRAGTGGDQINGFSLTEKDYLLALL